MCYQEFWWYERYMRLRTLDLFCGGGGSSWGAQSAGAEIVAGIDAWGIATETFQTNFPGASVFNTRLTRRTKPDRFDSIGEIDLLLASPECTNHTCARGNRPGNEESRRTAHYVTKFAEHFAPRWIVIENVIHMKSWHGYESLVQVLQALGYKVRPQTLEASFFGVPQTRRRLFLMCDRVQVPELVAFQKKPAKPARSILDPVGTYASRPLFCESRAANTIARYKRGLKELGYGEDFLLVYYGTDGSGGWQTLDVPLRTLTTLDRFGLITWRGKRPHLRMLQVPELRRAMGFDLCNVGRSFELNHGSRRDKVMLLGNGVAPPVMESIVRQMTAAEAIMAAE